MQFITTIVENLIRLTTQALEALSVILSSLITTSWQALLSIAQSAWNALGVMVIALANTANVLLQPLFWTAEALSNMVAHGLFVLGQWLWTVIDKVASVCYFGLNILLKWVIFPAWSFTKTVFFYAIKSINSLLLVIDTALAFVSRVLFLSIEHLGRLLKALWTAIFDPVLELTLWCARMIHIAALGIWNIAIKPLLQPVHRALALLLTYTIQAIEWAFEMLILGITKLAALFDAFWSVICKPILQFLGHVSAYIVDKLSYLFQYLSQFILDCISLGIKATLWFYNTVLMPFLLTLDTLLIHLFTALKSILTLAWEWLCVPLIPFFQALESCLITLWNLMTFQNAVFLFKLALVIATHPFIGLGLAVANPTYLPLFLGITVCTAAVTWKLFFTSQVLTSLTACKTRWGKAKTLAIPFATLMYVSLSAGTLFSGVLTIAIPEAATASSTMGLETTARSTKAAKEAIDAYTLSSDSIAAILH